MHDWLEWQWSDDKPKELPSDERRQEMLKAYQSVMGKLRELAERDHRVSVTTVSTKMSQDTVEVKCMQCKTPHRTTLALRYPFRCEPCRILDEAMTEADKKMLREAGISDE